MNDELTRTIDGLQAMAEAVTRCVVPDEDMPDTIGEVQAVERRLADWRRGLLSEAGPGEGDNWILKDANSAVRSFNDSKILADVGDATEQSLPGVLRLLIAKRAVDLKWRWTELRRLFNELNLPLTVAHQEIEDGDEAHVGEVWKRTLSVTHKDTYL